MSDEGVEAIRAYGVEAYPFTRKRIDVLETEEEEAKKIQNSRSILASPKRYYVISNDGKRVCFIFLTSVENTKISIEWKLLNILVNFFAPCPNTQTTGTYLRT